MRTTNLGRALLCAAALMTMPLAGGLGCSHGSKATAPQAPATAPASGGEGAVAANERDIPLITACELACGGVITDHAAYDCAKAQAEKDAEFRKTKCWQTAQEFERANLL